MTDLFLILAAIVSGGILVKGAMDRRSSSRYNDRQQELAVQAKEIELKIKEGIKAAKQKKELYERAKQDFIKRSNSNRNSDSSDKK